MTAGTKITKNQLKSIVKECLIEILQEGLGGVQSSTPYVKPVFESKVPPRVQGQKQPNGHVPRVSPLDTPATPRNNRAPTHALAQAIKAESRGNPLMADIFADTAMNTLPKMMSNGDSMMMESNHAGGSRLSQQEQFAGTPEEVFGEDVASKWANLAFMEAQPRN
jgi:hypothetical protein